MDVTHKSTAPSLSDINKMDIESLKTLWADISMPSRKSPLCYETARGKHAANIKRAFNAVVRRLNN
jgi:hypothetical protein